MKESADRSLTADEAFRAAFYMIDRYLSLDPDPSGDLSLLWSYMLSDPARHEDWSESIERARADRGWGSNIERPNQSWEDFER